MEIKNVKVTEIHWSIGWNASGEANKRLKDKLGDTSKYFAQLKVGNATYNWLVDGVGQWRPMGAAPDSEKAAIMEKAEEIRRDVFDKLADDVNLATKICQVPNYEEYIFYKENADGALDVIITGWGFHNFKKAGPFLETWPPQPKMHITTVTFIANGEPQAGRPFTLVTPKSQKAEVSDSNGQRIFREYAGTSITIIDDATKRQLEFTTTDEDTELQLDVTLEEPKPEPPVEEPKVEEPVTLPPPQEPKEEPKPEEPKKGSRLFEILMALLLIAALVLFVIFVLKPGVEELTKVINKNVF